MPKYEITLRIEPIYEVEAKTLEKAIEQAKELASVHYFNWPSEWDFVEAKEISH